MTATATANDLYHAAQALIREGQPVFPCRPSGTKAKAPYTRYGFQDASLDLAQVKRWWSRLGPAAIGIPTGVKYDVLDVDRKGEVDGRVHLPRLMELGLLNGCQRVARTSSGGWHLYFLASPALSNSASATMGLDVRALGGYVIAAPSYVETDEYAGAYEDMGATEGATTDPLLWDLIASSLIPVDTISRKPIDVLPSDRQASVASLREWMSVRQSGERNNALHWAVCRCIENGIDPHEMVEPALLAGLTEDETLLTVRSALRRAGVLAEELDTEAEALFPEDIPADYEESAA